MGEITDRVADQIQGELLGAESGLEPAASGVGGHLLSDQRGGVAY